jgi:hypothetical protein
MFTDLSLSPSPPSNIRTVFVDPGFRITHTILLAKSSQTADIQIYYTSAIPNYLDSSGISIYRDYRYGFEMSNYPLTDSYSNPSTPVNPSQYGPTGSLTIRINYLDSMGFNIDWWKISISAVINGVTTQANGVISLFPLTQPALQSATGGSGSISLSYTSYQSRSSDPIYNIINYGYSFDGGDTITQFNPAQPFTTYNVNNPTVVTNTRYYTITGLTDTTPRNVTIFALRGGTGALSLMYSEPSNSKTVTPLASSSSSSPS